MIGRSEAELRLSFCDVSPLDMSFQNLVSKKLHPYRPPRASRLLRLARTYVVFEVQDDKVVRVHRLAG
ncbi:MAG: hypothetical protein IPL40_09930 [Proteobacteria bacterium]|nr:hypothetical protein [Pseudomonadota bacterium]